MDLGQLGKTSTVSVQAQKEVSKVNNITCVQSGFTMQNYFYNRIDSILEQTDTRKQFPVQAYIIENTIYGGYAVSF